MKLYQGIKVPVSERKVLGPSRPVNYTVKYNVIAYPNDPAVVHHGVVPESVEAFNGFNVPGFSRLTREGWIIQNPMSKTSVIHTANNGAAGQSKYWWGATPTFDYHDWWDRHPAIQSFAETMPLLFTTQMSSGLIGRARDEAVSRVFAKAQTGNADLLIDISQIKSLVNMLLKAGRLLIALARRPETFLDIVEASRDGRRYVRVPPDGKKVPVDSLSGLWCELRFGWGPLLGTINGIFEAARRTDLDKALRFTYRAQEEINFYDTQSRTSTESWAYGGLVFSNQPYWQHDEEFTWRSTFRAGLLLEQSLSLSDALGLRVSAIPIAAWDLVPYSFIVDRFFNIGNWIRSLNPIPTASFGGAWVTERYDAEYRYRSRGVPYSGSYGSGSSYRRYEYAPVGEARYTVQQSGYVRQLVNRPPVLPVLRHDWSQLTSLFNLLDVVFLAIQRLKPRR